MSTSVPDEHIPELQRLKDISERLLSPEVYQRIVEEAPIALLAVDDKGRVVLFNRQSELLLGYSRLEVIGQSVEMFVPDARRAVHVVHRAKYSQDPQVRPMGRDLDLEARQKSGNTIPVYITLAPLVTTDGIFTMAAIRRKDT